MTSSTWAGVDAGALDQRREGTGEEAGGVGVVQGAGGLALGDRGTDGLDDQASRMTLLRSEVG
jgi:hypothetical protein